MEAKNSILVIDDDSDLRSSLKLILKSHFSVKEAESAEEALKVLSKGVVPVILLDIGLPGMSGLDALKHIKSLFPQIEVIMLTANADLQNAVQATKLGAFDFLTKPYNTEHLLNVCTHAAERSQLKIETSELKEQLDQNRPDFIVGQGAALRKITQTIQKIADKDTTVLISGETGTGKEVIARAIHRQSTRRNKPFIAINCGGIPSELLESELFGHEQGAFTSAVHTKPGKFELAQGGTLFLDELGNMPYAMQAKLLRVLQEKEIERVGGTTSIQIDVRIVAATNENLPELIKSGKFRQDLFYRLNVVHMELPPLRQRMEDLEIFTMGLLEKLRRRIGHDFKYLSPDALKLMRSYRWPGNIRELEHVLERVVTLEEGPTIEKHHLPLEIVVEEIGKKESFAPIDLKKALREFERELVEKAFMISKGNQTQAAKLLGVNRTTLINKIQLLGLKMPAVASA